MTLGGLEVGVTPLEWTYAYQTIANDGRRVTGTFAPDYETRGAGPIAYDEVEEEDGNTFENEIDRDRVIPEDVAVEAKRILSGVVTSGTGTNANLGVAGQWGKTGTTDDNGDAWFCGQMPGEGNDPGATACVWVGYPDEVIPMTTEYGGAPVDGGTFPALIWSSVMSSWLELQPIREAQEAEEAAQAADEADAASETDEEGALPSSVPDDPDGAEDNDRLSSD
jgi:penicillin-binding protein 1A